MAGEFTKSTTIKPAIAGTIANPDEYNQNIAGQSKDSILGIDEDGVFADFNIGDESKGTNGTLITDIKLRDGGVLKKYNASGVFLNDVNLGQATESLIGQAEIATQAETTSGSDDTKFITPAKLLGLYDVGSNGANGYEVIPNKISGQFDKTIYQYGITSSISTGSSLSVTFPLAFNNACRGVIVTRIEATGVNSYAYSVASVSTTGFTLYSNGARAGQYYWRAYGY